MYQIILYIESFFVKNYNVLFDFHAYMILLYRWKPKLKSPYNI
jgi:hypothetical protein